jgi:CBS domain-containing protein
MRVSEILHLKDGPAITISPDETVETAVHMFKDKKIGAVMVCDPVTEKLLGIVSERDVLHGISENGIETLGHKLSEIMSNVYTCKPDDLAKEVLRQMTFKHIRHFPVVEDGALKGIVSIGDILKNQLNEDELEIDIMRDYARAH